MNRINFQCKTGKFTLLGLTGVIPFAWKGNDVLIAGKRYKTEIVYDLPNHIAIIGDGVFMNEEVIFI